MSEQPKRARVIVADIRSGSLHLDVLSAISSRRLNAVAGESTNGLRVFRQLRFYVMSEWRKPESKIPAKPHDTVLVTEIKLFPLAALI